MSNIGARKEIVWRKIEEITPYTRNNKAHSPDQISLVARSINEHGFVQPIVIDKDGVIICGHCRHLAAQQLLMPEVPVIVADHLDENQVRKLRILDNRANEAPWNLDMLRFELTGLDQAGVDLRDVGFAKEVLGDFLETGFMPDAAFETRTLGTEFAGRALSELDSFSSLVNKDSGFVAVTLQFEERYAELLRGKDKKELAKALIDYLEAKYDPQEG